MALRRNAEWPVCCSLSSCLLLFDGVVKGSGTCIHGAKHIAELSFFRAWKASLIREELIKPTNVPAYSSIQEWQQCLQLV